MLIPVLQASLEVLEEREVQAAYSYPVLWEALGPPVLQVLPAPAPEAQVLRYTAPAWIRPAA